MLQSEWGDALNALTLDVGVATGFMLDLIGDRLGYVRPPVPNTDLDFFGYAPEDSGFDSGLFATSDAFRGPVAPIEDQLYRQLLRARGIFLRSGANRAAIEAESLQLVGDGNYRMTEESSISFARTTQLVGLTNYNGAIIGLTSQGHRYSVNPISGVYSRLTGDLTARVYSSLAFGEGDLYAISGATYYPLTWDTDSVAKGSGVAITGLDAAVNVSGPVEIDGTRYMATSTSLYTIDPDSGPSATRIAAFAPATGIRGLAAAGKTLYACDQAGDVRTVDVGTAQTALYQSTPASSLTALAAVNSALYATSASRLYIVDAGIKSNALSFSVDLTHSSRIYLDVIVKDANALISRPAGVGLNLRTHTI